MKTPDWQAEYMKRENREKGFESFLECFKDVYDQQDYEVIRQFAPIAKMMIEKELPQLEQAPPEQKKFTLKGLLDSVTPFIESIMPKKRPDAIKGLQGRTDISYEETKRASEHISEQIAPVLKLKLEELSQADRITTNQLQDTELEKDWLKRDKEELEKTKQELADLEAQGLPDDDWKLSGTRERIGSLEKNIERQERIIDFRSKQQVGSQYNQHEDKINLEQHHTTEDAIVLIHETAHAVAKDSGNRLPEVPAITAELVADKYMESNGLGGNVRAVNRVADMQKQAKFIVALDDVFSEYEQTGTLQYETVDKFMQVGQKNPESRKPEDYSPDDVYKFQDKLFVSRYFVGTASALVLNEQIKSPEELQNVFEVMNAQGVSDVEKLQQLGVSHEKMVGTLGTFVGKNKTQIARATEHKEKKEEEQRQILDEVYGTKDNQTETQQAAAEPTKNLISGITAGVTKSEFEGAKEHIKTVAKDQQMERQNVGDLDRRPYG